MRHSLLPLLMTIIGGVLYHLSSKSVPRTLHPLSAIIIAYAAAIVLCLVAALFYQTDESFLASFREIGWAAIGIGAGAAMIEVGFLLAYRAGWQISVTSIIVNVSVAVILIPVGLALFRERLSVWNVAGIILCLAGLMLISKK
ncbi:MAG TPA: EamA family transporter [Blastocatellia bacterium]|nr:EamA family transporter [Blastocatellia bacterium]